MTRNWGNWNPPWANEQSQYYFGNDQYYGIVAGNVEINTFDFVLKLDENLAAIPAYRGIHIEEKTLILELTSEDFATKKSADHLRIHPEPGVRAKKIQNGADTSTKSSDDSARTPTQSCSDVTQLSPVKESDSPSVSPHPEDTRLTQPRTQPKAQPKAHAIPSSNAAPPRLLSPKTDIVLDIPKPVRSDIIEHDDTRRRRREVSNLDDCQLQNLKKKMIDLKLKQDVCKPSEIADISPKTPTPRSGDISPVKSSTPPSFYRKDDHCNVPRQYNNTEARKRKTHLEKSVPKHYNAGVHKAVAQVGSSKVPLVPPDSKKSVAARRKIAAAAKKRVQKVDSRKVEVCISSDSPAESTLSSDSSDSDSSDISVSSSQIRSVSSDYSVSDSDSAITTGFDESLVCPKSHRLESFLTLESGWRCSVCNKKLKKKGEMFGCRTCDYDLCCKCADKSRLSTVETKCDKKKKRTRKAHKQKKETSREKSDRKKEERRERKREEGVRREKEEAKKERKRKKDKEERRIKSVDISVKSSSSSESEYSPVTSDSDSDNSSEESAASRSKSKSKPRGRRKKKKKKKTDNGSSREESKKTRRRSRDSKRRKSTKSDKSKRRSRDSKRRKSKSDKRERRRRKTCKSDRKSKKRKRPESTEKKQRKSKARRDESVKKKRSLSRTLSPTLSPPPSEEGVEKQEQEEIARKNNLFAPIGLIRKAADLNREREHSKKRRRH